jgi:hypothetical protein
MSPSLIGWFISFFLSFLVLAVLEIAVQIGVRKVPNKMAEQRMRVPDYVHFFGFFGKRKAICMRMPHGDAPGG